MQKKTLHALLRPALVCCCLLFALPVIQAIQWHMTESITGIAGLPHDNAMLRLNIMKRDLGPSPNAKQLTAFYHQGPLAIANALKPYGYFEPLITKRLYQNRSHVLAKYHVTPGPRIFVKLANFSIQGEGASMPYFQSIQTNFPIKADDPLNTSLYDQTKENLMTTAINRGYLNAHFKNTTLEINTKAHTAIINLVFDTGHAFTFGPISFTPTPLDDTFLQKYLPFNQGAPFDNNQLIRLQDKLGNSLYFDQVIVSPQLPDHESMDTTVPIKVQLRPKNRQNYKLSLGYGSNNGIRSSAQLELPFINSQGHHAQTSLTVAKKIAMSDFSHEKVTVDTDYPTEATLQFQYFIPGHNPSKEIFSVETTLKRTSFYTDEGRKPFTNREITGQYVNNLHRWKQIASFTYLHESSETDAERPIQFDIVSPGIRWTKLSSDNLLTPTHGSTINVNGRGVNNLANSDYNFIIFKAKARNLLTFQSKNRLLSHLALGYMTSEDQIHVPKTYQLLTGGSSSLRGFDYLAIGPGTHLAVAGVECQRMLENNWLAGIFLEGGNVYSHFEAILHPINNDDRTKVSQGFSLVKQTPIGSLNLSYARAKHYKPELDIWKWKWKWHFSIGMEL